MCNEYPGPRCSNHGLKFLQLAESEFARVNAKGENNSLAYKMAEQNLLKAQQEYSCTPDGIQLAKEHADNHPEDVQAKQKYEDSIRYRNQQVEALAEQKNGRARNMAVITTAAQDFYDEEEMNSIISSVRRNNEKFGIANHVDTIPYAEADFQYHANINRIEQQIGLNDKSTPEIREALYKLRSMDAPTSVVTLKTYSDALKALQRSQHSLKNELNTIAIIQNVPAPIARAYYDEYRKQYREDYANLSKAERPDPPKEWVAGDYYKAGFQNEPSSAFAPSDEASMYALYRLRVDEKAIPDYLKTSKVFAAVNLTESPDNTDNKPLTGFVFYNAKGKKLGQYETQNTRSLKTHLPEIATQLQGKTIVTQNNHMEKTWLKDSLADYGFSTVPVMIVSELSGKHLNLPDNSLSAICEKTGVAYENKNVIAETETTMKAFLGIRKKVQAQWITKPARKNAPVIRDAPLSSRW